MNYKKKQCPFCSNERYRRRNDDGKIKGIAVTCNSADCLKLLKIRTSKRLSDLFKVKAVELGYGKWSKGCKLSEETKRKISKGLMGRKATIETKLKLSVSKIGNRNPMWNGGTTKIWTALRNTIPYKHWRKIVFKRDDYKCRVCKSSSYLNAHHIESVCEKPWLIYKVWNGITLCEDCHKGFHKSLGNRVTVNDFVVYFGNKCLELVVE